MLTMTIHNGEEVQQRKLPCDFLALRMSLYQLNLMRGPSEVSVRDVEATFESTDPLGQKIIGLIRPGDLLSDVDVAAHQVKAAPEAIRGLLAEWVGDLRNQASVSVYNAKGVCRYTTANTASQVLDTDWGILLACRTDGTAVYRGGIPEGLQIARCITTRGGDVLGYVIVSMEHSDLTSFFSEYLSYGNDLFLLDGTWRTVYCTQAIGAEETVSGLRRQLMETGTLQSASDECNYLALTSEVNGFTLVMQQPRVYTSQVIFTIQLSSIAMGILCLILCLWGAWMLSRYLADPIHQLDEAMQEVERHNYRMQIQSDRTDEIGHLADSFNRMTAEYRSNLERSVQRQKELDETQLRMLHAQLNPHFLYNTLDSMKWLGITNHVPQVAAMSTNLAALLRMAISGRKMITMEEELELLERYLAIQSVRYGDRFTCEIDIPDQLQHCLIPKLLLQPLVENSIVHGIAQQEEGYIKIRAAEEGGELIISVTDNGCGIPSDMLEKINDPQLLRRTEHLGLYNISQIIKLNFGDGYGLSAESENGSSTCIRLHLPIIRKEP